MLICENNDGIYFCCFQLSLFICSLGIRLDIRIFVCSFVDTENLTRDYFWTDFVFDGWMDVRRKV